MNFDPLYTLAFMTALFGSGHCIGMCGGLVSALGLSTDGRPAGMVFHLFYNLGRTITYTSIGLAVGWVGSALVYKQALHGITRYLLLGSDLLVILAGLGTAGLFSWLNLSHFEFAGPIHSMTKAARKLRKLPAAVSALPLGILFGFLPCGFLYAMILTAAQSADMFKAAGIMLAFGLGTMPALFFIGSAVHLMGQSKRIWMFRVAGALVALMGSYNFYRHIHMFMLAGSMHAG
ncbi:sulfite exporter TauE/SafE family protein [Geopsychrobacter electrodiphilus]|uniref:sulfite exporter TauE/SafE family protein n=1 Tax=Geopsychrobacter electrodiphilus TaxID=225196 RepID=UPI00036546A8|nr:sulfite exporter TauE/SafE family protein [Geopsychrobacter electrodiphilus]